MRIAALLLIPGCLFFSHPSTVKAAGPPTWYSDFDAAEADAQRQQSTLLIHFHASWCGPCRRMEKNVLNTPEVIAALQHGMVAVKVDSDRHPELVRRFGISSLPADVFVDPDGRVISRQSGYSSRTTYVARLHRYRNQLLDERKPQSLIARQKVESGQAVATASRANTTVEPAISRREVLSTAAETQTIRTVAQRDMMPTTSASSSDEAIERSINVAARSEMSQEAPVDSQQTHVRSAKKDVSDNRVAATYHDAVRPWNDMQLGLGGYCPVSLSQTMAWKAGGATFEHVVDGVCYRLSTTEQLDRFRQAPEQFFPALHGYDAVAMKDGDLEQSGAIELGARYRGRLFFFANAANRDRFLQNPNPYADLALGRPELLSTAVDTGRGL